MTSMKTITLRAMLLALAPALTACAQRDLTLPSAEEVESRFEYEGRIEATIQGNVAAVTVWQDPAQLRRGGSLWARVGPYIFVFSDETRSLFRDFTGLAGVRVTTMVGESEVATALLAREELSDILWRRSLNISGRARRDGTHQVTLLEDLVRWGEEHTEYEYNQRFTSR